MVKHSAMPDEENKEPKKQYYYRTIMVKNVDPEKGLMEFDKLCNEFEMSHDVECRTPMLSSANGTYLWAMNFCCEVDGGSRY